MEEEEGAEVSKMSEAGRVHHNRVGTGCCRGTAEGGSTVVAESTALADMAIRITAAKLVARPADRRRLNWEACWGRVAVEEDSTAMAGNTVVAGMAIHITTIMLEARRVDRRRACMVKEEGIITEGGSMVKGEG